MERYTHYGVEVTMQYVDSFREALNKNGIQYIDIAINPDIDVLTYTINEEKKYALIRPMLMPDDYTEKVYITSQTPDDCNWNNLVRDVDDQCSGAKPMMRRTRVKMLLAEAERAIYENMPEVINVFSSDSVITNEDELIPDMQLWLASHNINHKNLIKMEHYDVNEEFLIKLSK